MPYISEKVLRKRDKDSFGAGYKSGAGINQINADLLSALKGLTDMYGHAWHLMDGSLMMMGSSIPRFEKAHAEARKAIIRAAGIEDEAEEEVEA